MNRSEYSSEDFVLDADFRDWVLRPNQANRAIWENFLEAHPHKAADIQEARLLLINLSKESFVFPSIQEEELWKRIVDSIPHVEVIEKETPIIPISQKFQLPLRSRKPSFVKKYKSAMVVLLVLLASASWMIFQKYTLTPVQSEVVAEEWVEHHIPKGQKSKITLTDGTKVIVNSGSKLRHIKNFEENKREIFLTGEAYFEVAKDESRPFTVISNDLYTTALGTAFNVKSSSTENVQVSLVEGSVKVLQGKKEKLLSPGNAAIYESSSDKLFTESFDEEQVLAWTKKIIFLKNTDILEVFEMLENWYGIDIEVVNTPKKEIKVTGKYQDQLLKSVLSGLSYTAGFNFEINGKHVKINFI